IGCPRRFVVSYRDDNLNGYGPSYESQYVRSKVRGGIFKLSSSDSFRTTSSACLPMATPVNPNAQDYLSAPSEIGLQENHMAIHFRWTNSRSSEAWFK